MKAPYKHLLFLLFPENPELGKLGIIEPAMTYFFGMNIKAYVICHDEAKLDAA